MSNNKNKAFKAFATFLKNKGSFHHRRASRLALRRLVREQLRSFGWCLDPDYCLRLSLTEKQGIIWSASKQSLEKYNGKAGWYESIN
jgi:hypothetical protein